MGDHPHDPLGGDADFEEGFGAPDEGVDDAPDGDGGASWGPPLDAPPPDAWPGPDDDAGAFAVDVDGPHQGPGELDELPGDLGPAGDDPDGAGPVSLAVEPDDGGPLAAHPLADVLAFDAAGDDDGGASDAAVALPLDAALPGHHVLLGDADDRPDADDGFAPDEADDQADRTADPPWVEPLDGNAVVSHDALRVALGAAPHLDLPAGDVPAAAAALDEVGVDAQVEHADLPALREHLDAGARVVLSSVDHAPAVVTAIDDDGGVEARTDDGRTVHLAPGALERAWADSAEQLLVADTDTGRVVVLPVAVEPVTPRP